MFRYLSIVIITLGLLNTIQIIHPSNGMFVTNYDDDDAIIKQQRRQQQEQQEKDEAEDISSLTPSVFLFYEDEEQEDVGVAGGVVDNNNNNNNKNNRFPSIIDVEEYDERDLLGLLGKRAEMHNKRQGNTPGLMNTIQTIKTKKVDSNLGVLRQPQQQPLGLLLQWDGPSDTAIQTMVKANIESAIHTASILLDDLNPGGGTSASAPTTQIQVKIKNVQSQLATAKQTLEQGPLYYLKAYVIVHAGLDLLVWLFKYNKCCTRAISIIEALQQSLMLIILLLPNNQPIDPESVSKAPTKVATKAPTKNPTKGPTKVPIVAPTTPTRPTSPTPPQQQPTPTVPTSPKAPTPILPQPLAPTPMLPKPLAPTPIVSNPLAPTPTASQPVSPTPPVVSNPLAPPTPTASQPVSPTPPLVSNPLAPPTPRASQPVAPTPPKASQPLIPSTPTVSQPSSPIAPTPPTITRR